MSWERAITLECDEPGCTELYGPHRPGWVNEARRQAWREGWATESGNDFCPRHRPITDEELVARGYIKVIDIYPLLQLFGRRRGDQPDAAPEEEE